MSSVNKQRILLVDDEPQVLVALEDLLSDKFVVTKADSAERALSMMEQEPDIAVVVTDQRMPRMTGDEMLARIGDSSDARRILVTGYADLSAVVRAVNDGKIFAYVTKPWNAEDLKLKVQMAADQFKLTQALAEERKLLHDLMDSIPDGIYFKDKELRFLRVNRAIAERFGLSPAELVGRRATELRLGARELRVAEDEELRILEVGKPAVDVVREVRTGSERRWFSETKAPIRNQSGEVIGLVCIARDVSERFSAQEALAFSEERLRQQTRVLNSILDDMGDGVLVTNQSGEFILSNREARRILGGTPEGALSSWAEAMGVLELDQKTPLRDEQNPIVQVMAGREAEETELYIHNERVAGTSVAMTATPLKDDEDAVTGGIALLRDVTERRQLERQLLQSQKMEAIGQLAGGVAHDFNNLLAVIQSYGEIVLEDLAEGDSKRDDMSELLGAAHRAEALTKQLLAFSRQQPMRLVSVDLNAVVISIERLLRRLVGEGIELETKLAPAVGLVRGDVSQMEQIVLNLAINARDAMPEGGRLTIRTYEEVPSETKRGEGAASEGTVVLSVEDTGVGMSTELQKRIFEPFFTTKDVGKGTGLGLSTVYGIVRQSGGRIGVESQPGRGTRFEIRLPLLGAPASARPSLAPASHLTLGNETIFLIEDDEAVRRVAARILVERGYTVIEAASAGEAGRLFARHAHQVDLIVSDLLLPEIRGPELIEEITRGHRKFPVLYVSGRVSGVDGQGGLDADYIEKPFTPNALSLAVRRVLARR